MKQLSLFLICFGAATIIYAQNRSGVLRGKVVNSSQEPVAGATVHIKDRVAITNAQGIYYLANIPAGRPVVWLESMGNDRQEQRVLIQGGDTTTLNFTLETAARVLDEITVAAFTAPKHRMSVTRLPLSNLESPQVYNVVPLAVMKEQQVTTLQEGLKNISGVSNISITPGGGGTGVGFTMRGFTCRNFLRNGMAAGSVTLNDMCDVERIEVIKGPSGTLFSSGLVSYGGVLNIVTKKPYEAFGGAFSYTFGSFQLSRAILDVNLPLNEAKTALFRLNGAFDSRHSFQAFVSRRTVSVAPSLTLKPSDRLTLRLDLNYFETHRPVMLLGVGSSMMGIEGNFDGIDNVSDLDLDISDSYIGGRLKSRQRTSSVYARATYELSDHWISQTNYSYTKGDNNTPYIFLTFLNKDSLNRRVYDVPVGDLNTLALQQNFIGDFMIGQKIRNRLLIGVDYLYTYSNSERATANLGTIARNSAPAAWAINEKAVDSILAGQTYAHYTGEDHDYGAYITDVINLTPSLNIMAGLRFDRYIVPGKAGFQQNAWSPKLGFVYQILPRQIALFANYMDGFKHHGGRDDEGNAYQPEHANQFEGGVKINVAGSRLAVTMSYYDIRVRNVLRRVEGKVHPVQDGEISSKGFDIDLLARPFDGLRILAGYGYNDSRYIKAGDGLSGKRPRSSPLHSGNFWISYHRPQGTLKGLGLGFGGNLVSECYYNDANTVVLNGYSVFNAALSYDYRSFRVGLALNNIANKQYWIASYYIVPQAPRNISVNLTYRF